MISYEGTTASELVADFHEAVGDYLYLCEEDVASLETAHKGSLNIRFKDKSIHKRPRSSTFIFRSNATFSVDRYDKYIEYSFFSKLPGAIRGITRFSG